MKTIAKIASKENIEFFGFEVIDCTQMNDIRGGGQPKTRDKDMFDLEEE